MKNIAGSLAHLEKMANLLNMCKYGVWCTLLHYTCPEGGGRRVLQTAPFNQYQSVSHEQYTQINSTQLHKQQTDECPIFTKTQTDFDMYKSV